MSEAQNQIRLVVGRRKREKSFMKLARGHQPKKKTQSFSVKLFVAQLLSFSPSFFHQSVVKLVTNFNARWQRRFILYQVKINCH